MSAHRVDRRPADAEWTADYHGRLIATVEGDAAIDVLNGQTFWMCELASHVSAEQIDRVHPPHSWTVRQVIAHCVDVEHVFVARMLHAAAGDPTPMAGFDENAYADARFGLGNLSHLIAEWGFARMSLVAMLRRIRPACWDRRGTIDGDAMTLRAMAWFTAAHARHHLSTIEDRIGIRVQRVG